MAEPSDVDPSPTILPVFRSPARGPADRTANHGDSFLLAVHPFLFACPLAAAVLTDHSFRTTGSWVMLANLGIPRWIALAAVTAAGTLTALTVLPFAPLIDQLP